MAIALGINNVITFITALSPIIIGSFFILSSVFNVDFSGFIWFIGIVLLQVIAHLMRKFFGNSFGAKNKWLNTTKYVKKDKNEILKDLPHDYCSIFEPFFQSDKSTFLLDNHVLFHSFTLVYLLLNFSLPENSDFDNSKMIYNFIYGYIVIVILDIGYRIGNKCIALKSLNIANLGLGLVLGGAFGAGWWFLIKALTYPFYHKYLLLGSNTLLKCNISDGVFQCKTDSSISNYKKNNEDEFQKEVNREVERERRRDKIKKLQKEA